MEFMDVFQAFLRWIHVFAGIIWLGYLFFFGFIFSPMLMDLAPEARGPVLGGITTRLMKWLRPTVGLAYLTGLILLGWVFHAGGLMFETGFGWGMLSGIAAILPFLLFVVYDLLARSPLGPNMMAMGTGLVVLSMAYLWMMEDLAGMTYRASMIHLGVTYGTIIAANVFMKVIPAQKSILQALSEKRPPDPEILAALQVRAKHNIYLAVPLVWAMLNQHTVIPGASSPLWFAGVLLANLGFITYLYKPSAPKG